jgi:hypothetical protein
MVNWLSKLKLNPIDWLINSNPWTSYRTLIDLSDKPLDSGEVIRAKQKLENDPLVKGLINETNQWFPVNATRHNVATLDHYKLRMLADFGFTKRDIGIQPIIDKAIEHLENGLLSIRQTLPFKSADPGIEEWHSLPCDMPILTYTLLRLGETGAFIDRNVEHLKKQWKTKQGWFCHFSFVNSQFKKLQIGCPMAGLMALEVFSLIPELMESEYTRNAYEPIKYHKEWGQSLYYFGRSKKFWTMKYPFVWYNALYLAEVLTRFEFTKNEPLLKELIDWIEQSQTPEGTFKPTSMFTKYKTWDFADKKQPSPWITYLCCRILKRYYFITN